MRLPPFVYRRPRSVAEAIQFKHEAGADGAFVAGGTDLYPNMKRRHQTPSTVIDVMHLPELRTIEARPDGTVKVGAGTLLRDIGDDALLQDRYGALVEAVRSISTPLLRNMGTLGGNVLLDTRCNYYNQNYEWRKAINFCMKKEGEICWVAPSSPRCWAVQSSDTVPVLVAMGATLHLEGPAGPRRVTAADMFRDDGIEYLTKLPDELLTAIVLPPLQGAGMAFRKLRRRGAFDFAVLNVASWIRYDAEGLVAEARIIIGAVGSAPLHATQAEALVTGTRLDEATCVAAAEAAYRPAKPMDNTDFAYAWRKQMVRKFVRESLLSLAR